MPPRKSFSAVAHMWVMLIACACNVSDAGDSPFGGGADAGTAAAPTTAGSAPGSGTAATAGEGAGSAPVDSTADGFTDDGPKLDVQAMPTTGSTAEGGDALGCTKADLLFVVDNSSSMLSYQARLAEVFPYFIDAIFEHLPEGTDVHVGVTTSSFCASGLGHSEMGFCEPVETHETVLDHYKPPTEETLPIEGGQGRLVEHDGVAYFSANTGDPGGSKWPLIQWFSSAALVGGSGCAFEFPAAGAAYAAHPANDAANDGFFRDEGTLLLVFVLSDEGDQSPEDLEAYHDMLLAKKAGCGGDACIIAGGLISPTCIQAEHERAVIWPFLNLFGEEPIWGDIRGSSGDYVAVLAEALATVIGDTCDQIPPEG